MFSNMNLADICTWKCIFSCDIIFPKTIWDVIPLMIPSRLSDKSFTLENFQLMYIYTKLFNIKSNHLEDNPVTIHSMNKMKVILNNMSEIYWIIFENIIICTCWRNNKMLIKINNHEKGESGCIFCKWITFMDS